LRRFIFPFNVPTDVAKTLNMPGKSIVSKEKIRIEHALREIYMMKGRVVFNAENAVLPEEDATPVLDTEQVQDDLAMDFRSLEAIQDLPLVRLGYEPMKRAINPVFFTYFVSGVADAIGQFLTEQGLKYRSCTGDTDDEELGAYLRKRDSSLIASGAWSVGVDGSQKCSNAIATLGLPWHDSGHRQLVARVQRQGAVTPVFGQNEHDQTVIVSETPTTVLHEIIPVAMNVEYDLKRLNKVYARRTFTQVLSLGQVEPLGTDDKGNERDEKKELEVAVNTIKSAVTPG
jgi:hypothetical protein